MKKLIAIILSLMFAASGAVASASGEMVQDSVVADGVPGRLMWVPDSLADGFRSVLEGRSKIVRDYSLIDPKEKVVVKGDTVPLIIRQRNLGRFDRGLFNFLFIPKGQWLFALTASYGEFSSEDLKVFDLLSYFVRNNVSVGLRLNYTKAKASLGSMSLDFSDDMSFAISDIGYLNEEYSAAITSAQYIGLARGSRFGIFNEVELAFASGNSEFRRPYNGEPKETNSTYMQARLSFSPGVCVFIMKNVSFNVSFGVFGFYLRNEKQTVNGEPLGNRFTSGANFKFNIFNINFGIGVHI